MYHRIGQALLRTGNDSHPTDWLLFLCPGKREVPGDYLERLEPPSEPFAKIFRETLRFPIYVHSKMMGNLNVSRNIEVPHLCPFQNDDC